MRLSGLLLLALSAPFAQAADIAPATVAAIQAPAWVERDGQRQPLAIGMPIRNGDRLSTGAGARAYVRLADGSLVKLGEDARLNFYSRGLRPRSHFRGALDATAGAFRYTADARHRVRGRELSIRVGTATAGSGATDLWGKSTAEQDLLCLMDGHLQVAQGGDTLDMEAMTLLVAPKGKPHDPLAAAAPEQVKQWAQETDIAAGGGASRQGGRWKLLAGHAGSEADALALYDQLRDSGFDARVMPMAGGQEGAWAYDLLVKGFASEAEAATAAKRLKAQSGLEASPRR